MAVRTKSKGDTAAIRRALAAGQLTVTDPATGYHRSVYADCPNDGHASRVWQLTRMGGNAITDMRMHCSQCDRSFTVPIESLYLR